MPSGEANPNSLRNIHTEYAGTVTTVTDQAGKQRRQVVDALGRVKRVDEPNDQGNFTEPLQSTSYDYDALDNLVRITQGIQNRYFKYDSLGRLTHERQVEQDAPHYAPDSLTNNNNWSRRIVYNSHSLVADAWDARQINTQFVYDGLNRVSQITYSDSTPAISYYYDSQALPAGAPSFDRGFAIGRPVAVTYGGSTSTTGSYFGYDSSGRVNTQRQVTGSNIYSMSYGYNQGGLLLSETYPSGRVMNYAYDEGARLSSVTDNLGTTHDSGFQYAAHGALTSETFGNTAVHAMSYNKALQPSQVKLTLGVNELQRYDYLYGKVTQASGSVDTSKNNGQIGRVDSFINGVQQWDQRFVYDSLGRLSTAAEYKQGNNNLLTWQGHYDYDRWGNRSQYQQNINLGYVPVLPADVDTTRNRLVSGGAYPTSYDAAGNVLSDRKFRFLDYQYDANGRQTQVAANQTNLQTAIYDAMGQRVQTTAAGATRQMVYDAFGQLIADYKNGGLERENIYRGGQLLATDETAASSQVTENVAWTNAIGVSVSGSSMTKTSAEGWGNAGGVSSRSIVSGDGYVEFTVTENNKYRMIGLFKGTNNHTYEDLDFGLYARADGTLYIYEKGVGCNCTLGSYAAGDRLRVAIESGVVKYRKNGVLFIPARLHQAIHWQVTECSIPTGPRLLMP